MKTCGDSRGGAGETRVGRETGGRSHAVGRTVASCRVGRSDASCRVGRSVASCRVASVITRENACSRDTPASDNGMRVYTPEGPAARSNPRCLRTGRRCAAAAAAAVAHVIRLTPSPLSLGRKIYFYFFFFFSNARDLYDPVTPPRAFPKCHCLLLAPVLFGARRRRPIAFAAIACGATRYPLPRHLSDLRRRQKRPSLTRRDDFLLRLLSPRTTIYTAITATGTR